MKLRFYYGTRPKLSIEDTDNFSRSDYKCRILLQTKRGAPVAISEHKDTGIWKVTHGFSTVVFGTKAEALAYCRGRFLDLNGKVSLPYRAFLGYRKGKDGLPEIVPEEAEIVKRIYAMFMQGKTSCAIAKILTADGIPTPSGKQKWSVSTVDSILRNEKYCGDARLQKTFTVDFLQKKMKTNEGEVPQYYVQNSHPAIIDPYEWDLVQAEIARRKELGQRYSANSVFSATIVCGDCGAFYGAKVWHSTDQYRRTVWQCNDKFKDEHRCKTPHLAEQQIQTLFLRAFNKLHSMRESILEDSLLVQRELFDCTELDAQQTALAEEMELAAELVRRCVEENSLKVQDQME